MRLYPPPKRGKVRGCAGNMTSGKTGRLIGMARMPSNQAAGVVFLQPIEASRSGDNLVQSRTMATYEGAIAVSSPTQLAEEIGRSSARNVFLEEIQFHGKNEAEEDVFRLLVRDILREGRNIFWSGLPLDFRGEPFEIVAMMMAMSGVLEVLPAECAVCGNVPAPLPQRLEFGQPVPYDHPRFLPDTKDFNVQGLTYEPRCEDHHIVLTDWNEHSQAIHAATAPKV